MISNITNSWWIQWTFTVEGLDFGRKNSTNGSGCDKGKIKVRLLNLERTESEWRQGDEHSVLDPAFGPKTLGIVTPNHLRSALSIWNITNKPSFLQHCPVRKNIISQYPFRILYTCRTSSSVFQHVTWHSYFFSPRNFFETICYNFLSQDIIMYKLISGE